MATQALSDILAGGADCRVLCIGDLMLDRYVYGHIARISPEAPVPVIQRHHTESMPGGAANVALNLLALGGHVHAVGVCGSDEDGAELLRTLSNHAGLAVTVHQSESRRTTTKTRFVASGQQVLRVDEEDTAALSKYEESAVFTALGDDTRDYDAVVVSDYAKGMLTPSVLAAAQKIADRNNAPLIIDPKGTDLSRYGRARLIKPNAAELSAITGCRTTTNDEVEHALAAALDLSDAQTILVTRGSAGLSYLSRGTAPVHVPAPQQDVFDVSGAGDTSLAAIAIALAAKAGLGPAADLAIAASSIAVSRAGTVAVSAQDIMGMSSAHPTELSSCQVMATTWRAGGLRIGFTNGCFDILHAGHVRVLEEAKARCDRLIVGLNSDASVRRLKGAPRPVNTQQDRARLLLALSVVDVVVIFDEDTPEKLIAAIVPDLLVKGGDYSLDEIVGADLVSNSGGDVYIVPLLEGHSTTAMIDRTRQDD